MALKSRLIGSFAVALASLAGATAADASQVSGVQVIANLYSSGVPVQYAATIGALETGCEENTTYQAPEQYGPGGSSEPAPEPPTSQQWTVPYVLANCLGMPIQLADISEVIVYSSDNNPDSTGTGVLTQSDLADPSDFVNNELPLFWDAGSTVNYERPSRSQTDDNSADAIQINQGGSLDFDVYTNGLKPQVVTVTASPTTAAVHAPVTFRTQGLPSGETYYWDFPDVATSTSASPTVSFPDPGQYQVTVRVTGQVAGYGSLQIQIGPIPPATGTQTTKTGPVKSKGRAPGGAAGKHKHAPAVTKQKRKRHRPTKKTVTKTTTATTTTATAGSTPPTTPAGGGGSGGGSGSTPGTGAATTPIKGSGTSAAQKVVQQHRSAAPKPPVQPKRHPAQVTGRVLGAVEPLPGGAAKLVQDEAEPGSAPRLNVPGGQGPWALIASLAAVVALLALGAERELRHVRSAR